MNTYYFAIPSQGIDDLEIAAQDHWEAIGECVDIAIAEQWDINGATLTLLKGECPVIVEWLRDDGSPFTVPHWRICCPECGQKL